MNAAEVESLVREIIIHFGWPITVVSVLESPTGWTIVVRTDSEGIVRFTVSDGPPAAIRARIQETLEVLT